jgi:hypothetical protein
MRLCGLASRLRAGPRGGIPIVIDIDEMYDDSTHELLRLVDYLIASSDFAEDPRPWRTATVSQSSESHAAPMALCSWIKENGSNLSLQSAGSPTPPGAGDVFHGGFHLSDYFRTGVWKRPIRFCPRRRRDEVHCRSAPGAAFPSLSEVQNFLRARLNILCHADRTYVAPGGPSDTKTQAIESTRRFQSFWNAKTPNEAESVVDEVLKSGVAFDDAYRRLKDRPHLCGRAHGVVKSEQQNEGWREHFYALNVPANYDPAKRYQVRFQAARRRRRRM